MTTLLAHSLQDNARIRPDKTALVAGGARVSYAELDAAVNRMAHGLLAAGVAPGDRVLVHLENSVEAVIAIFAILRAGAVFSVVNPSTKAEKLSYLLQDAGAAALLTSNDPRRRPCVLQALHATPVPVVVWVNGPPSRRCLESHRWLDWSVVVAGSSRAPDVGSSDLDLAALIYTSGTTGSPKGVMSAHRDMIFAARSIACYLDNTADDVLFSCLPLAHTYGLYQLITSMLVGATLVLEPNFAFPARALQIMAREGVTGFAGVPTMFTVLLRLRDRLANHDLSALRYFTNAAAPLPAGHLLALRAAFPRAEVFSMYGQTECKRACYLPPGQIGRRPDSVGIPIPGTDAYVVDEAGRRVTPGVTGELVVRGPHLMRGYWGKPAETAARLRPGPVPGELVLHTGDLFRCDEDGFLYFVSRADDVIKCRGEKVSPQEIETALRRLPGVADAAAVGVPDDILGEAVKVVVVREAGTPLSESDVRAFCSRRLEEFLIPKYVEFRAELPRSEHGKTLRRELRTCAA